MLAGMSRPIPYGTEELVPNYRSTATGLLLGVLETHMLSYIFYQVASLPLSAFSRV